MECSMSDFKQQELIETDYHKESASMKEDKRMLYILIMLLYDDAFFNFFEGDIDSISVCSEENFLLEHFDFLKSIFTRAVDYFDESKFLDE